jgi:hypothetical protein
MSTAAWVLVVATHLSGGTAVQFQETDSQAACTALAGATRQAAVATGGDAVTKCMPKGGAGF